jgi:hypothetical protein
MSLNEDVAKSKCLSGEESIAFMTVAKEDIEGTEYRISHDTILTDSLDKVCAEFEE